MTTFDEADWHRDAALAHGQPPEQAFTHIGVYLRWLIRNDLVNPTAFPLDLVRLVVSGGPGGSRLHDASNGRLASDVMTAAGATFTAWYYPRYLDDVAAAFAGMPAYGVPDDRDADERIGPTIDRRYGEWLAAAWGDELPASAPGPAGGRAPEPTDVLAGSDADDHTTDLPHDAPELEALLPLQVGSIPLQVSSARVSTWQSSLLRRAIQSLGADPDESFVALGLGGEGRDALAVTLYAIPGVPQDRLEAEFSRDAYLPGPGRWERREVGGTVVWWCEAEEFDTAFYALGGLVVTAGGSPERVLAALDVLP